MTVTQPAPNLPEVVSPEVWLAARRELLVREKELTHLKDALAADRRRLPMVRVEKDYTLVGPDGPVGLLALFDGALQLVVQHVMFDPAWDEACSSCTAGVDEVSDGLLTHLRSRETALALVSRAPYEKLVRYARERGWRVPWYSSAGSSFNLDFHVSLDPAAAPVVYNYRDADELEAAGMGWITEGPSEQPGHSCFLRVGDEIFHTYSTFGRGSEQLGGSYGVLDITALGRQEDWEEPRGRSAAARAAIPTSPDSEDGGDAT